MVDIDNNYFLVSRETEDQNSNLLVEFTEWLCFKSDQKSMSLLLDLRRKWFAYFIKRLQSNDSAIVEVSFLKNLLINFMYSFKKYLLIIVYFENLFVNLQEYQHLIKLLCEVLDGDVDPLCNMQPKLQTQKTKPNNFPRQVCTFRQNHNFFVNKIVCLQFQVFVGNLPQWCGERFLKVQFSKFGKVILQFHGKNYGKFYFDSI